MLKRTLISLTLALLLAGGLVYGIAHLFALRYEKGDVYPPYSTLRADPLGAKGLYDAAERAAEDVRLAVPQRGDQPRRRDVPVREAALLDERIEA